MSTLAGFRQINEMVEREARFVQVLNAEIRKAIIGQDRLVERALVALLADGHILLERSAGVGEDAIGQDHRTSNPSWILTYSVHSGPVARGPDRHANLQPSNRRFQRSEGAGLLQPHPCRRSEPGAGQSAERPAGGDAGKAGHNRRRDLSTRGAVPGFGYPEHPIEQEGTYPLPEAQVDRFMLKVVVDYPERSEEREIIDRMTSGSPPDVQPVVDSEYVLSAREIVRQVYVDEKIKDYVLDLVIATRNPSTAGLDDLANLISYGASPRAGIFLISAARAYAFIKGRGYVVPDDVKQLAPDILRHRIITTFEAEAQDVTSEQIAQRILENVEVP